MTIIILPLLALIGCGHVLAQECLNGTGNEPTRPTFPRQFSTEVEANIFHLNQTIHVTEYYDNINERGRIDTYSEFSNNVTLVNYDTMEVSHIMTINGSKTCFAAPLSANSSRRARNVFGAQLVNGTAHILTPSQFLRFGDNETYIGPEVVRGIPCDRWQSCNISAGSLNNYTVDYYFSQADWDPSMVPVQIVVNGTSPDSDNGSAVHEVYNVYSYVNFRPGPADDDLFRVPPGQVCSGRSSSKELPPLPKDYFSALYEATYQTISTVFYYREYYSNSQQLYRLDFDQSFTNSTVIIEDFDEGVQYRINGRYGSCNIISINSTNSIYAEVGDDGMVHLQSIKNHFLRQDEYNYTYEGVSQVRKVDAESWISQRDREVFNNRTVFTNGSIQVFYTLPGWNISYGYDKYINVSVPWRSVIAGNFSQLSQEENSTYFVVNSEVLEFRTEEPNFDVFDVSVCFSVNQYTTLRLILPLPDGVSYTSLDHSLLRTTVRSTLSVAANVSASRLGGINILERSNNSLLLNINVLDTPTQSRHYSTAMPRDEVVSLLTKKVNAGEVTITLGKVDIVPSVSVPPSSCPNSVQPSMTYTVQPNVTSTEQPNVTYTVQPNVTYTVQPNMTTIIMTTPVAVSMTAVSTPTPAAVTVMPPPSNDSVASVASASTMTTVSSYIPNPTATCDNNRNNNNNNEDDSSLTPGATAGLTIGVFVLGVLVGVLSTVLTCWLMHSRVTSRSGKYNTSSYSKQRDDVVI